MTEPSLPTTPSSDPGAADAHLRHDELLVAGLVDRAAEAMRPTDRRIAEGWVASCATCAALHADLTSLAMAIPTSATPSRPRDFRLSPEQAARLQPVGWRRWIAAIGSARDAFTRPLAIGLTTMGVAGLLVASAPSLIGSSASTAAPASGGAYGYGGGGAAPERSTAGSADSAAGAGLAGSPAAAGVAASAAPAPDVAASPAASSPSIALGLAPATGTAPSAAVPQDATNGAEATTGPPAATTDTSLRDATTATPWLVLVAGAMLLVGLGLFALRWMARRLGDG